MNKILFTILTFLCVSISEPQFVFTASAQQTTQSIPYWKTVVNSYPKSYKVIAVYEVYKNEWVNILYSNAGKYYSQTVCPKKKAKDTPEKVVKKGDNIYQIVNEPEGYLKVTSKTVDGISDGVLMESWKRLDK